MNLNEDAVLPPRRMFRKAEAQRTEKEWSYIRIAILDALEPFPGAREAVVQALVEHCMNYEQGGEQEGDEKM